MKTIKQQQDESDRNYKENVSVLIGDSCMVALIALCIIAVILYTPCQ